MRVVGGHESGSGVFSLDKMVYVEKLYERRKKACSKDEQKLEIFALLG